MPNQKSSTVAEHHNCSEVNTINGNTHTWYLLGLTSFAENEYHILSVCVEKIKRDLLKTQQYRFFIAMQASTIIPHDQPHGVRPLSVSRPTGVHARFFRTVSTTRDLNGHVHGYLELSWYIYAVND